MVALRRFLSLASPVTVILALASMGLAQDTASDQAKNLLDTGAAQYKALEFQKAKETFLSVNRDKLPPDGQKALDEYLKKVDPAIKQQAAANEAFNSAEKALAKNDLAKAKEGYTTAVGNEYFQPAMRKAAETQLALVESRIKLQASGNEVKPAPEKATPPAKDPAKPDAHFEAPAKTPTTAPAAPLPAAPENPTLSRVERANALAKQIADLDFQKQMTVVSERLADADTSAAFDAASSAARLAKEVIETNKMYFTSDEYRARMARVADQMEYIEQQKKKWEIKKKDAQVREITINQAIHDAKAKEERRQKIDELIRNTNVLRKQNEYGKALELIDQILILDPQNSYALDHQDELKQLYIGRTEGKIHKTQTYEESIAFLGVRESEIPWDHWIKYPTDWRDITKNREKYGVTSFSASEQDRAALQKLDQKIPKLDFNDVNFDSVVQFFRDVENANIDVKWPVLQAAGIEKTAKVNVHLTDVTFKKGLRVVLDNVGGATALSYVVDEGVITISTKDDLSQKTISRVYDISDMIVRTPNFPGPVLDLAQTMSNTGNGGGGGGGGLFCSGSSGACTSTEENNPTKDEMIKKVIETLKGAVQPDSWKPEGTVGQISELGGRLIVLQTADAHAELSNVISQLRESRTIQIAIEARFITISSGFLESIGLNLNAYFNLGSRLGGNVIRDPTTGAIIGPRDPFTNAIVPNTSSPSGWGGSYPGDNHITPIPVTQGSTTFTNMLGTGSGIASNVTTPSMTVSGSFLDDIQVDFLLQATQASATTRTLVAPRITISNGQRAYVTVGTQQAYVSQFEPVVSDNVVALRPVVSWIPTGSVLDVEGTVSADRRYVTLTVRPQVSTLNSMSEFSVSGSNTSGFGKLQLPNVTIEKLETTVSVPDGGTLLLGGQKLVTQVEREQGVPLLSKIPIINRAFTNRGMTRDEQTLLILIKPKIMIQREQEDLYFPP